MVIIAAALRLGTIGQQGLWYDEAVTSWLLRADPARLFDALPQSESAPPLFYAIAWLWVRVAGNTDLGLRSLSLAAGVGTVPVAFAAARDLAGRSAGLITAALVAVNPLLIWYSQEARAYSLLVLLSAASFWLFVRARTSTTRLRLLAWAVASALAIATHYFAAFAVMPEAIMLLGLRATPLRWRLTATASVALVGIALAGLARSQSGHAHWIVQIPLATRIDQIAEQFMVGFNPPATRVAETIAAAVVVAALLLLAFRSESRERRGAAIAAVVGTSTIGLPLVLAVAGVDYVNGRNVLAAMVPLEVTVALGLAAPRARALGAAGLLVAVGVSLAMVAAMVRDPSAQRPRWPQVVSALRVGSIPKAILIDGTGTWARPLNHYLPSTWWARPRGTRVTEIDVLRRLPGTHTCGSAWWGASCEMGPQQARSVAPVRGFRLVGSLQVAGFGITRYLSSAPVRVYSRSPYGRRQARGRPPIGKRHLLVGPGNTVPAP